MDIDQTPTTPKTSATADDKMEVDEEDKEEKDGDKKEEAEASKENVSSAEAAKKKLEKEKVGYELENMSRVLPAQLKFISFPAGRYQPVKKPTGGVILLVDTKSGEPKELIEEKLKTTTTERAAAPPSLEEMRQETFNLLRGNAGEGGSSAVASVLGAIDDDDEEGAEAEVPESFEYFTENEDEEES